MSSIPCFAWWFVAGLFGGWLLWWLIDRLFLRNGDAAARLASLEAAQEAAKAKEARLTAEFEEQRGQLAAAQTRLTDTTSQLDHYATLETAYNTEYAKILKERDGLKAQLSSTTGEITRLNTEHTSADHEIEASHGQISALQDQLRAAQAHIESLTGEAGGRAQDLKLLQSKLAAASENSAQIPSLQMEIARLKEDLEKAVQRGANAADFKADADAARGSLNAQSAEIARLKDLVAVKTRGEEAAARQVAELKALLGTQRDSSSDIARLKAEIDAAHGENQRLDKELHVAQEWLTRTGTELETSRSAHSTANGEIARLKEHITSLNDQIGQYERLRNALEAARQAADLGLNIGKKS